SPAQANRRLPWWGRKPLDYGANGNLVSPSPPRAFGGRNGLSEPRSGFVAPADQGLASNHAGFLAQTHAMSSGRCSRGRALPRSAWGPLRSRYQWAARPDAAPSFSHLFAAPATHDVGRYGRWPHARPCEGPAS